MRFIGGAESVKKEQQHKLRRKLIQEKLKDLQITRRNSQKKNGGGG